MSVFQQGPILTFCSLFFLEKEKPCTRVHIRYSCKRFAEHNIKSVCQEVPLPEMLGNKQTVLHSAGHGLNINIKQFYDPLLSSLCSLKAPNQKNFPSENMYSSTTCN